MQDLRSATKSVSGVMDFRPDGDARRISKMLLANRTGMTIEADKLGQRGQFSRVTGGGILAIKVCGVYMPPVAVRFGRQLLEQEGFYKSAGKQIAAAGYLIVDPKTTFAPPAVWMNGRDIFMLLGPAETEENRRKIVVIADGIQSHLKPGEPVMLKEGTAGSFRNDSEERAFFAFVKLTKIK